MPCPKISQKKLSQIAIKSWNLQTFSPLKVSYYMVQYYMYSLPDHYAHTCYYMYWFQSGPNLCDSLWMEAMIKRCKNGTCIHQHEWHDRNEADSPIQAGTGQPLPQRVQSKVKNMLLRTLQKQYNNKLLTSCSLIPKPHGLGMRSKYHTAVFVFTTLCMVMWPLWLVSFH